MFIGNIDDEEQTDSDTENTKTVRKAGCLHIDSLY